MRKSKKISTYIILVILITLLLPVITYAKVDVGGSGGGNEVANKKAASKIDDFLKGMGKLEGKGNVFVAAGNKYGVDAYFMVAISVHETGRGTSSAIKNKNNTGGYMGKEGIRTFSSVDASIEFGAKLLSGKLYIGGGVNTVESIRNVYAPPNVANDPNNLNRHWVDGVNKYYKEITGDNPGTFSLTWSGETDGVGPMPTGGNDKEVNDAYIDYLSAYDESSGTGIYYEQTEADIVINYKFYRLVKKIIVVINWVVHVLAYLMIISIGLLWALYVLAMTGLNIFSDVLYKLTKIDVFDEGAMHKMLTITVISIILISLVLTGAVLTLLEKIVLAVMRIRV